MFNKNKLLAVSFSAIMLSQPVNAVIGPIKITLNPTELSSNYFNEEDTSAPFASEVYTEEDIKNSKSNNYFRFLLLHRCMILHCHTFQMMLYGHFLTEFKLRVKKLSQI